jgi:putative cell wall-binding protein
MRRIRTAFLILLVALGTMLAQSPSIGPAAAASGPSTVTGTVVGADGAKITGWVAFYRYVNGAGWNSTNVAIDPVTGRFTFSAVQAGQFRLLFRNTGSTPHANEWWGDVYRQEDSPMLTIEDGQTLTFDAKLDIGGRVEGVIDSAGGPLANVTAYLTGGPAALSTWVRTDASGAYSFDRLAPGDYTMRFDGGTRWKQVDQAGNPPGTNPPSSPVHVGLGQVQRIDLTLQRTAAIEGTVTVADPGGAAPYRGTVRTTNASTGASLTLETTADGRYEFSNLTPGDYFLEFLGDDEVLGEFYGDASDADTATRVTVHDGEVVSGIDASLAPGAHFKALVKFSTDAPLPLEPDETVWIELKRFDEQTGEYRYWSTEAGAADAPLVSRSLPAGRYSINTWVLEHPEIDDEYWDDARYFVDRTDVVLTAGQTVDLGTIVLDPRTFDVGRIAGADRYETAVKASQSLLPDGDAPVVYIANGLNYPDALAAGPAASTQGGVVLLIPPHEIPAVVVDELERLTPARIVVAGGSSAISDSILSQLKRFSSDVERIGGADRYATANLIVRDAFLPGESDEVFIATARNFPDALAAGPAAAQYDAPVVLVDGLSPVSGDTAELLIDLGVKNVYFVGGTEVLTNQFRSSTQRTVGSIESIWPLDGADRFEVARMLSSVAFSAPDYAYLTTGLGFADALAGGPLAGAMGAPLFLANTDCVPISSMSGLVDSQAAGVTLLGGTAVLSSRVEHLTPCG